MSQENINFIFVTLDRFEGTNAILVSDNNHQFVWPVKNLPTDSREGDRLRLVLFSSLAEKEEREKVAKSLLNEILKE